MLSRAKEIGLVARRAVHVSDFRAQSYCFYDKKKNSVETNVRFLTFFSYISNTITIHELYEQKKGIPHSETPSFILTSDKSDKSVSFSFDHRLHELHEYSRLRSRLTSVQSEISVVKNKIY